MKNSYKGKKYKSRVDGKKTKAYVCWSAMRLRVYSKNFQTHRPSYTGCKMCDEWHDFQVFAKWHSENYIDGFELDKDLLSGGQKVYSPETCVFLPRNINTFLSGSGKQNKTGYDGVSFIKRVNKFRASGKPFMGSKIKTIGHFYTPNEAYIKYQSFKAEQVEYAKQYMRSLNIYPEEIINLIK